LRERCAALVERDPEDLVQILLSRYPAGAGIGWHRDAPMFGSKIAGVSLGEREPDAGLRLERSKQVEEPPPPRAPPPGPAESPAGPDRPR